MATALNNNPPISTTAMVMTEPSSTSSMDEQHHQQQLSSSSSTVSQSPIQEGSGNEGGGAAHHSCSKKDNKSDDATPIIQQQQLQQNKQRSNNTNANASTIINPYKKTTPNVPSIHDQDPKVQRRGQFIEKWRLQSLHNNNHRLRGGGGGGVIASSLVASTSRSALEVMRSNQHWRQQWRRREGSSHQPCTNDSRKSGSKQFALRPRLFLFQRMMTQPQRIECNTMTSSQPPLQQQGTWELGTGVTEVSGEGGSGKTQICLSLCMTCALTPLLFLPDHPSNSNNGNDNIDQSSHYYTSIYITMGEGIPQSKIATRLHQMLRHRSVPNIDNEDDVERILSRIWLLSLKNEDDFIEFVEVHLPNILDNQFRGIKPQQQQQNAGQQQPNNHYPTCDKIGFIAFDGIANFFRFSDPLFQQHHLSTTNCNQKSMFHQHRSSKLFQISSALRRMSDVYDVPIVITNQVTTSIPSDDGLLKRQSSSSSLLSSASSPNKIQPALGLIWSNCVTTRFILQRKDGLMAKISTGGNGNGELASSENDGNSDANNKNGATSTTTMLQRVRKACVLQSVCVPVESEVWYFIDTGAVVAVS